MDHFNFTFWVVESKWILISAILSVIFTVILLQLKTRWNQIASVIGFAVLCLLIRVIPLEFGNKFQVSQLNVGQGDALLIQQKKDSNRSEMIDVGSNRTLKAHDWLLVFSKLGTLKIDALLLSHLDEDHAGALNKLSYLIPIGCIESNIKLLHSDKGNQYQSSIRQHQVNTRWTSANCVQLSEHAWLDQGSHGKGNALMAGSLIEVDSKTVYLAAGDADQLQEEKFYYYFKDKINQYSRRIWKVSHHGSKFSTDLKVLQKMKINEAWISVGKYNHYHHPHFKTLSRLVELGIPVHRTDEEGVLTLAGEARSNAAQWSFINKILK